MRIAIGIAFAILATCLQASSQVRPTTSNEAARALATGGGLSIINPDFGHGRLYGGTFWLDYGPLPFAIVPRGVGLEMELRDIHFRRAPSERVLREDSALAGVIYTPKSFYGFAPYFKAEWGFGNVDYSSTPTKRYHQTRTITAFGGGLDWSGLRNVTVRLDYEYQILPQFFLGVPERPTSGSINPQGITVGAIYHLPLLRSNR